MKALTPSENDLYFPLLLVSKISRFHKNYVESLIIFILQLVFICLFQREEGPSMHVVADINDIFVPLPFSRVCWLDVLEERSKVFEFLDRHEFPAFFAKKTSRSFVII